MKVHLVIEQGRRRRVYTLGAPGGILGRQKGCAVRIPSAAVSRRHCRLRFDDGLVILEDLDSVNGTYLNERRVTEREYVHPGDRLDVGPVTFIVEYEPSPQARARLQGSEDLVFLDLDEPSSPVFELDPSCLVDAQAEQDYEILLDEDAPIQPDFDLDPDWE